MQNSATKAAERRASRRINVRIAARAVFSDQKAWKCTIHNYCSGGLFVDFGKVPNRFKPTDFPSGEKLRVEFLGPDNKPLRLVVTIAHAYDHGIGLAFTRPEPDALVAFKQVTRDQRDAQQSDLSAASHECEIGADAFYQAATDYFDVHFPTFNEELDKRLQDALARSTDQQQFEQIISARTQFKSLKETVRGCCEEACAEGFRNLFLPASEVNDEDDAEALDFSPGQLSLVDDERFEEWVLVSSMVSATEAKLREDLFDLHQRLSQVAQRPIDNEDNPASPHTFAWTLKEALRDTDLGFKVKKIIYQCFGDILLKHLKSLYSRLNEILVAQGAEEEVHHKIVRPRGNKPAASANDASPNETHLEEHADAGAINNPLAAHASPASANDASYLAGIERLLKILPNLPSNGQPTRGMTLSQQLQQLLTPMLGTHSVNTVLTPDVQRLADLTDSLTHAIPTQAINVPALDEALARLTMPLFQLALTQPGYLSDASHPAHDVLNHIGRLSLSTIGNPQGKTKVARITNTINHIAARLEEPDADPIAAFAAVENELSEAVEKEEMLFEANVARVIESCRGEERLANAKEAVRSTLQSKILNRETSMAIVNLLNLGWLNLLVLNYLRAGPRSDEWPENAAAIDQLADWFQPAFESSPADPAHVEEVIHTLQKGFVRIAANQSRTERAMEHIRKALLGDQGLYKLLNGKRIKLDVNKLEAIAQKHSRVALRSLNKRKFRRHIPHMRDLREGTWLLQKLPDGQSKSLSYAWHDGALSRFVFVDSSGHKSLDCDAAALAEHLQHATLTILLDSDLPLTQRTMQEQLRRNYEDIAENDETDHLTGLLNRRHFEQRLAAALESCWERGEHHLLATLAIDQLKMVNDTQGRDAGDELIRAVADLIKTHTTAQAHIARMGDEFSVLIENCTVEQGAAVMEKQRRAVEAFIFDWQGHLFNTTVSIGITAVTEDYDDAFALFRAADAACFLAKDSGRNQIRFYTPGDQQFEKRQRLVHCFSKIDEVLTSNKLQLFLQPIRAIDREAGLVDYFEVLMRMKGAENRLVAPIDLIEAAEAYNRMRLLDRWVVNTLFDWLDHNEETTADIGGFSINLSGQSIGDKDMEQLILSRLESTNFPRDRIAFEITETSAIADQEKALAFMHTIKEAGAKFYLDDFGTGLSSYSYLKSYPFDSIKIDGCFIRQIINNDTDRAMVKSITEIGHFMGKKIIAEYVENEEIVSTLREIGVDYAQGWGVGKPFPIDDALN